MLNLAITGQGFFQVMMPNGQIDFSWLPGKRLRERLKAMGKAQGIRYIYFPAPISKTFRPKLPGFLWT